MHIGLLEDDIAIQEMLLLLLQDEGYSVAIYPSGEECIDALTAIEGYPSALGSGHQERPLQSMDLLIVDWQLGGLLRGTEVIRQLRSMPMFASLPIILTTAAPVSNTEELHELHVSLLEKPFAIDIIAELVKSLIQPKASAVTENTPPAHRLS